MTLHLDEHEILSSNGNKIVLTNQRIQMNNKEWGRSYSITIFLEDISSIRVLYTSNVLLIIIAALCLLYSVLAIFAIDDNSVSIKAALVAGLILLGLWWLSRRHIISIHPDGGKPLEFLAKNISEMQIDNFMEKVQWAKAQRINKLFRL